MSIEPKAGGLGSRHFRVNTDPLIHVIIVGLLDMCVCVCVCVCVCMRVSGHVCTGQNTELCKLERLGLLWAETKIPDYLESFKSYYLLSIIQTYLFQFGT